MHTIHGTKCSWEKKGWVTIDTTYDAVLIEYGTSSTFEKDPGSTKKKRNTKYTLLYIYRVLLILNYKNGSKTFFASRPSLMKVTYMLK